MTVLIGENRTVETNKGKVTAYEWCVHEAERLLAAGIAAKAVRRNGQCYVYRSGVGCVIEPDSTDTDDDSVTASPDSDATPCPCPAAGIEPSALLAPSAAPGQES